MPTHAAGLRSALLGLLEPDAAARDLTAYFRESAGSEQTFTGRHFERLGGGGDGPDTWDRFTASDLVAVEMLSVQVDPEAAVAILDGDLADPLRRLLTQIPTGVSLLDPEARTHLADGSPADQAWRLL